jgi:hypothetical protein
VVLEGLISGAILAKEGFKITVLEKNQTGRRLFTNIRKRKTHF